MKVYTLLTYIKGVFMANVLEGKTIVLKTEDVVTLIKSGQIDLPDTSEPHIADKHPEAVQIYEKSKVPNIVKSVGPRHCPLVAVFNFIIY